MFKKSQYNKDMIIMMSDIYKKLGNYYFTIIGFNFVLHNYGKDYEILKQVAEIYINNVDMPNAGYHILKELYEILPPTQDILKALLRASTNLKLYKEGSKYLKHALEWKNKDDELYVLIGDFYKLVGKTQDAEKAFLAALKKNPENKDAQLKLI